MISRKLDRSLLAEVDLRRKSTDTSEGLGDFKVIIELADDLAAPDSGSRDEKLTEMKQMAERSQASLVAHLESLGVSQFESLTLSNSIATELTFEQIESVAGREDVRRIRLRRIERVTTTPP